MVDYVLEELETKTDHLLTVYKKLQQENSKLLQKQHLLLDENQQLLLNNRLAQEKIEALLNKLKNMVE